MTEKQGGFAEFYAEFRQRVTAAGERPYSFPESGRFRRVNLRTFPHHFLFEIAEGRPSAF
jgi:hypothetical protein